MTDGERARELMVRLYNFLDCEPGDDGEILFQLKDAFAAVREEAYCKGIEDFVSDAVNGLPLVWKDALIQRGKHKIAQAIRTGP